MDVDLTALTVHCESIGDGRPLVFLPGWPDDWRAPAGYMEPLFASREGWRRIYVDLPGRGGTPGVATISTNDQVLQVILELLDRLLPEQRFAIAGHSYGGYLARAVLNRRMDQVDGLLNVVPIVDPLAAADRLPRRVTFVENPDVITRIEREQGPQTAQLFAGYGGWLQTDRVYERLRDEVLPGLKLADQKFLATLEANLRLAFDVDRLPMPFDRPALFVVGRQDADAGYLDALALLESYPQGTIAVLDRASHALPWEQTTLFEALVANWLDRTEARR